MGGGHMSENQSGTKLRNYLTIALLSATTAFTAYHEGFFPLITFPFLALTLTGVGFSVWLATGISSRRLISLILSIFIVEYFKETIGVRSGFWSYNGNYGQFNFGIWSWVLAGLTTYTFATRLVIPGIRKLGLRLHRLLNSLILSLILAALLVSLGPYRDGADALFYTFYIILFLGGLYASFRTESHVFLGLVLMAWFVGNPSEYLGAINSKLWTFTHNQEDYPPFFLLFSCWPLEILAQYSLSAYLAGESLNEYS
jgi:hypothetical protein